jgi:hypothetical protein
VKRLGIALCLLLSANVAPAQPPAAGSRVRVTLLAHPDAPITGTLLAYRPESLTIAAGADSTERAFVRADLLRLERSTGMHNKAGKGALIGAVAGGVGAALLGALFASAIKEEGTDAIPIVLGAGGAIGGGLIGAAIGEGSRHEGWEVVGP